MGCNPTLEQKLFVFNETNIASIDSVLKLTLGANGTLEELSAKGEH